MVDPELRQDFKRLFSMTEENGSDLQVNSELSNLFENRTKVEDFLSMIASDGNWGHLANKKQFHRI